MKSFILLFCVILFIACNKSPNSECQWYNPPSSLFFQIKQNGIILPDSILTSLKISYIKSGVKTYISDLTKAVDDYAKKGILTTRNIGSSSADSNIKSYYLEYPNGDIENLLIDYHQPTKATACLYTINLVKFNNIVVNVDTSFAYKNVYIFNK